MTPDSNGILMLEETDPITPFQTTINTLQAATSTAIGGLSQPKMYAVKGTGSFSLPNNAYDWIGTASVWSLVSALSSPPPEFSYATSNGTTLGQGLQANVAGNFRLTCNLQWDANSTGYRFLRVVKNGTIIQKAGGPAAAAGRHCEFVSMTARLDVGDRLGVQAYQSSGSALALYSGEDSRSIIMEYLGK